ncbi:hypothetical protein V6Z90_006916 [Aspergillus fumigatus]
MGVMRASISRPSQKLCYGFGTKVKLGACKVITPMKYYFRLSFFFSPFSCQPAPPVPVACLSPATLSIQWFFHLSAAGVSCVESTDVFCIPRPPDLLLQLRAVTFPVAKDVPLKDIGWHSLHHCH